MASLPITETIEHTQCFLPRAGMGKNADVPRGVAEARYTGRRCIRSRARGYRPVCAGGATRLAVFCNRASPGTAAFLAHWVLRLDMASGGYVLSKRLSRLLQPYCYWTFCAPRELPIAHVPAWEGRLWDGCGRVSR